MITIILFLAAVLCAAVELQAQQGQGLHWHSHANDDDIYRYSPKTPTGHIRCGTMEHDSLLHRQNPGMPSLEEFEEWMQRKTEEYEQRPGGQRVVLTIPVVVHIVHNGDPIGTDENITDAQVLSQLQVLNEDFRRIMGTRGYNTDPAGADVEVEFCLAQQDPAGNPSNGIIRHNLGQASWEYADVESTVKPGTQWNPDEYLNMWTVRFGGGSASLLGYAQFPDPSGTGLAGIPTPVGAANTDGVVMLYSAFGSSDLDDGSFILSAPYDLGRTTTHEVGHWLGLRHIWGDGDCTIDDYCADTPDSDDPNYGCATTHISCTTDDMENNYMDYSEDACMNIFTVNQKARVQAVLANSPRRATLPSSPRCDPPAPIIAFNSQVTDVTENTDCGFQDITVAIDIALAPSADATVNLSSSGSASDGPDYTLTTSTLLFQAGNTASQSFDVRVYNDGVVEGQEDILIDFTVSTTGDAVKTTSSAQTHTVRILDDDAVPVSSAVVTILQEDFETGTNFTTSTNATTGFALGDAAAASSMRWTVENTNASVFVFTEDAVCNCDRSNDQLDSPPFDLTGYSNATLTFDHAFADVSPETASLSISTDGGISWTPLTTLANTSANTGGPKYTTPWVNGVTVSLDAYVGNADVRLRFSYNDGGTRSYGLAVDNILVTSTRSTAVQTQVNSGTPDQLSFGASQTVYWADPSTGDIMASLQNGSGWSYDCTDLYVDRDPASAGGNTAAFWSNNADEALAAKTFFVNPTANNTSGAYTITLYYTEAEIAAWETATGKPRSALEIVKVSGSPISAVTSSNFNSYTIESAAATLGSFGPDVTLSASFSSGFSGFGIGAPGTPPSTLDVSWLSFTAEQVTDDVVLRWATASEENSSHFIVQRSTDAANFESIGEVAAAGNSNTTRHYEFTDTRPQGGYNYYRLQQVDRDGSTELSNVVVVNIAEASWTIKLAPNPVSDVLQVQLQSPQESACEWRIMDIHGRVLAQQQAQLAAGPQQISISCKDLAAGLYILSILRDQEVRTLRFVKE